MTTSIPLRSQPTSLDPRVYLAAERTHLAWIRTALALMGFGFIVARFNVLLEVMRQGGSAQYPSPELSIIAGLGLIAVGVGVLLISSMRYRRYTRTLEHGQRSRAGFGFGVTTAIALALIGALLFVQVLRVQL